MGIKDMLAADLAAQILNDGEAATHIDAEGAERPVNALISMETRPSIVNETGRVQQFVGTALIVAGSASNYLPQARHGDEIARGEETFTVTGVQQIAAGAVWRLEITQNKTVERSRDTYRLRP